tara:strand:- start:811 stop:1524 length:714 start_codon:yes stop_codon:yes gene_type:complete
MSLTGGKVTADDVYETSASSAGLFDPALTPDSVEILNGGLDLANYGAGDNTITPHAWQVGSFMRGYHWGFDEHALTFASQLNESDPALSESMQRVVHDQLSVRIFLPWTARAVYFGFQGFFQQDATLWTGPSTDKYEKWILYAYHNDTRLDSMTTLLGAGRKSTSSPTDDKTDSSYVHPYEMDERFFRWVNRTSMETNVGAGYHEYRIDISHQVAEGDNSKAKLKTVSGACYIVAIR